MIKKLLCLAACSIFSLNANAGYVQYNFEQGAVQGYIVQHDDDKSIAYYNITVISGPKIAQHFGAYPGLAGLYGPVTTREVEQPTNFGAYDNLSDRYYSVITFMFGMTASANGSHYYSAQYHQTPSVTGTPPGELVSMSAMFSGWVTPGQVDPAIARELDGHGGYMEGIEHIVPNLLPAPIPEPGSLALLAVGALGIASASRRRKL